MDVHKFLEAVYRELKKIFTNEEHKDDKNYKVPSKNNKMPNFLIICLTVILVGILVVIANDLFKTTNVSSTKTNTEGSTAPQSTSTQDYENTEENRLKAILEDINGVGRVNVMVTIEGTEEQVPAVNVNDSTSDTKEKDNTGGTRDTKQQNNGSTVVFSNDGSKNMPLILKTYKPKVVGVVVVAEGAKDNYIQVQIREAVTRAFNIKSDKVSVYPMKK
jgi:stage III sporulation protein AG